jgi:hypothetical protein
MDPLSIIGSAAGIATASISLVTILFETLDTYRNAPKEISTIARGIQDLSFVLDQLVEVLSNDREIHTRRLRTSILAAVRQIGDVHEEVWELIERGESGFGRVKWTFRKNRMRDLVARIEALKNTIQIVCTTLLLAMQQRRVARSKERDVAVFARRRLRRQAENLVNAAYQSLLDLTKGDRYDDNEDRLFAATPYVSEQQLTGPAGEDNASPSSPVTTTPIIRVSESDPRGGNTKDGRQLASSLREDQETAASFLYQMVFSRTAEENAHQTKAVPHGTNALVIHNPRVRNAVLANRPFASTVVDNLLHDWTSLSDQEIKEAAEGDPQDPPPGQQDPARVATSGRHHTAERSVPQRDDPRENRSTDSASSVADLSVDDKGKTRETGTDGEKGVPISPRRSSHNSSRLRVHRERDSRGGSKESSRHSQRHRSESHTSIKSATESATRPRTPTRCDNAISENTGSGSPRTRRRRPLEEQEAHDKRKEERRRFYEVVSNAFFDIKHDKVVVEPNFSIKGLAAKEPSLKDLPIKHPPIKSRTTIEPKRSSTSRSSTKLRESEDRVRGSGDRSRSYRLRDEGSSKARDTFASEAKARETRDSLASAAKSKDSLPSAAKSKDSVTSIGASGSSTSGDGAATIDGASQDERK